MTVLEAIKSLLQENPKGLTCHELTDLILARNMYVFNTQTPNNIVNHELRKHCEGLNFPSAHPVKYFKIAQCHAARCERRKQQIIFGDSAYSSVPYRRRRHACAGSEARSCSFI